MSDELLKYYNRELSFLRRSGAEFAEAHPKIASRLRLGADTSEDPHVERLLEAFAYLTARIRHKLDDDFPELTDAILGVLYPHYLAPVPSMAIVQFDLHSSQNELTAGFQLARDTMIETDPIQGQPCRFRTSYPVTLWPIDVKAAKLSRPPFAAPPSRHSATAASVLRLSLRCRSKNAKFSSLGMGSLRFYLHGQTQHARALYELLLNNALDVLVASSPQDSSPVALDRQCLRPAGFESDEGLLPYTARSFLGYRLLTEYFTFPEKFLFLELADLPAEALKRAGQELEIYIYFNRSLSDLEQNVTADTFRLGCTPTINLFSHRAEPIRLTQTTPEYRVVPDSRRPLAYEIYSIDRVVATNPAGDQVEYSPFFSVRHSGAREASQAYWHASRRAASPIRGQVDEGTEIHLGFVDSEFAPAAAADWTINVETTCLNRDLPHRLPFGGDQPRLQLSEPGAPLSRIACLTAPTRTIRPASRLGASWRLISHLTLNHLSLADNADGTESLREILKLYDFADSADTRSMIDGLLSVRSRRVVGRVADDLGRTFCRGVEVTIQFDEQRFAGTGAYLFASVLERFLGLYCSLNSFTRLVATVKGRAGELRRWAPRAGEKILL